MAVLVYLKVVKGYAITVVKYVEEVTLCIEFI